MCVESMHVSGCALVHVQGCVSILVHMSLCGCGWRVFVCAWPVWVHIWACMWACRAECAWDSMGSNVVHGVCCPCALARPWPEQHFYPGRTQGIGWPAVTCCRGWASGCMLFACGPRMFLG